MVEGSGHETWNDPHLCLIHCCILARLRWISSEWCVPLSIMVMAERQVNTADVLGLQALPAWQSQFDAPKGIQLGLIAATYYL
jgi:hypothetical protein